MTPGDFDVRAIAEVLADVLIERGLVAVGSHGDGRILDAMAVAALLGRERQWVYDHADELAAFRYGDGPRARLGLIATRLSAGSACGLLGNCEMLRAVCGGRARWVVKRSRN